MFSLVINAVLIVYVQQLVFNPADLCSRVFPCLVVQTVFLVKLSQAHHGLFTYTPLYRKRDKRRERGKKRLEKLKMTGQFKDLGL